VVRRIAHPGRPIILIDEGPALALRHRYDQMRRDLDIALAAPFPRQRPPKLHTELGQQR
jgi:signal transduction histidine kinase